jgi:RNA polymerase sigma-70 factor (ECF subfamily)
MKNKSKNICNPKVFEELFNKYAQDIKRYLYYKFGDLETAEDIMQDAFVKLWQMCENVDYKTAKNLLYTIANNLFLNVKKHEKVVLKNRKFLVRDNNFQSPEFLLEEKEFLEKIENVLASLTEKQREVFLLSRIEDKKYREIAEMLNISVKAVEKRMHKALFVIKNEIGDV